MAMYVFIVMQASVHLSACLPDAGAVIKQKTNIVIYTTNRFNRHAGYPDIPWWEWSRFLQVR